MQANGCNFVSKHGLLFSLITSFILSIAFILTEIVYQTLNLLCLSASKSLCELFLALRFLIKRTTKMLNNGIPVAHSFLSHIVLITFQLQLSCDFLDRSHQSDHVSHLGE